MIGWSKYTSGNLFQFPKEQRNDNITAIILCVLLSAWFGWIWGGILEMFPTRSHPPNWNPKFKDFWKQEISTTKRNAL